MMNTAPAAAQEMPVTAVDPYAALPDLEQLFMESDTV